MFVRFANTNYRRILNRSIIEHPRIPNKKVSPFFSSKISLPSVPNPLSHDRPMFVPDRTNRWVQIFCGRLNHIWRKARSSNGLEQSWSQIKFFEFSARGFTDQVKGNLGIWVTRRKIHWRKKGSEEKCTGRKGKYVYVRGLEWRRLW